MMNRPLSICLILAGLLATGCSTQSIEVDPAGESFLPLAVGNRWIFEEEGSSQAGSPARRDTVEITARTVINGREFYLIEATWPGFYGTDTWLSRGSDGNINWSQSPNGPGRVFLRFDAEVGQRWPIGEELHSCLTSLQLLDDYAVINTPLERFDGAREIGGGWIDCSDFGWTADFVRGIGPVRWEAVTIAGPTNWLLVRARIHEDDESNSKRVIDGE